jgi:hypothetical protein
MRQWQLDDIAFAKYGVTWAYLSPAEKKELWEKHNTPPDPIIEFDGDSTGLETWNNED